MMMHWSSRNFAIFGVLTLLLAKAALAYCPPQYQEEWVEPVFESATQALEAAVQAVDTMLAAQLESQSQQLTSAVAVLTKQRALTANQVAEASRTSMMATADALRAISEAERVKSARFTYGGEFGQGYQPCLVQSERTLFAAREGEMSAERGAAVMQEVLAAPGVYADPEQAQRILIDVHRGSFCSQAEVDSGLCARVGNYPAADLNAGTLFTSAMQSDPYHVAKLAFVNNLVGMPDPPVPEAAGRTPAAQSYMLLKQRKDAVVSPALASLKEIQLDYTGVGTQHLGSDVPLAQRLKDEVSRYMGNSEDHQKWAAVLAGQTERGLLVEALKVKALDLVLLEKQYRQFERMEAQLAVQVASGARGQASRAAAAAAAAQRGASRGAVE